MQAIRSSQIQQELVKRLVSELEAARSEPSQRHAQKEILTAAQKRLEESLAESGRRLKEEVILRGHRHDC